MKEKLRLFIQRVREREGEHEQVTLRVFYALIFFLFLTFEHLFNPSAQIPFHIYLFSLGSLLVSVGLMLILLFKQKSSRKRQWVAMVADIFAITYGLLYLKELGFLLFGVYLWLIVGNGIRYGIPTLFASYILSLLGFTLVITFNPFWNSQPYLAIGLLLTLTLIPLYLLKLLKQLNAAMQNAKEANQAKSKFLAHMSHEMRTPLNGVIGTCDLLTTTPLNGEQFDLVSTLKISAQTLLQLIENVLDFSKIESGKLVSERQDFDLHQLIRGTLDMFRSQARLKGLRLNVRFSPDTCYLLRGDTLHLRQVIINLVGNALKFTDAGSVELRIRTVEQDEQVARIRFEVIDTGIGIAPDAQKTIFDSFTQASTDISRQYGGSGLGTTISQQLVHLMGGAMGLQSELDVGSVFWFELPFEKQAESMATVTSKIMDDLSIITVGLKLKDRDAIGGYLKSWGVQYQHDIALPSFLELLKQIPASKHKTTVVLCSPQNLGVDARDFLQKAQSACTSRDLPIIMLANDHSRDEEFLEMGYACSLSIPVDKTLLFNGLHSIMAPQPHQGVISFKEYYQRSSIEKVGVSILLAEDNGTSRKIISKILEYGGHKVDLAENGEEALDKLEAKRFDLIILDMNMPIMGGLEVLKIHRATSLIHTPVIILTANATTEAMRECQIAGADTYMSKPVEAATLLEAVNQLTSTVSREQATDFIENPSLGSASEQPHQPQLLKMSSLKHLELLGEGQEDFMTIVIHGFISETEKTLETMRVALSENDFRTFKELAHTVKGSAGNIGAESLHLLCRDIMAQDETALAKQADSFYQTAHELFKATQKALTEYLHDSGGDLVSPRSTQ
ncbi:MAG: response regulator [Betaproteobacteria bacterium]|nr:response regulator [Betaproteobacteria bacterium]